MTTPNETLAAWLGNVVHGDCVAGMQQLPAASVDLAFADPPFNIGYKYDVYDDKRQVDDYLAWSREWLSQVYRVLKPDGTFWLMIGDEMAAELKCLSQSLGFHTRSWVPWYYTFGVNCTKKLTRSHAHLFHFVKNHERFTFNDQEVRIPSARLLVYNDKRANPDGRLPDDTWIIRPDKLEDGFPANGDVWCFARVAGTFGQREPDAANQVPEQLLGRIIRLCSNENDLVLDPFGGTATTAVVAKKLRRRYLSFELSQDYAARCQRRLQRASPGEALQGTQTGASNGESGGQPTEVHQETNQRRTRRRSKADGG